MTRAISTIYQYLVWVYSGKDFSSSSGLPGPEARARLRMPGSVCIQGYIVSRAAVLGCFALLLAGCSPYSHGFKVMDPATNCKDCYHSLYFLTTQSEPGAAVELALAGDYAGAENSLKALAQEAETEKELCLLLNNRGLLRMLQDDSSGALGLLWRAHSMCPNNETIERNLKILLSRFPDP